MTNNEAAKWIQLYIDLAKIDPTTGEAAYLNDDNKKTIEAMEMAISALTAQPETHDKRTETHACDLISRQAALNAMDTWDKFGCDPDGKLVRYDDDNHYVPYVHYDDMVHAVKHLPSALPEIIRCGQCKYAEVADKEDAQDGYTCQFHRGSVRFSGSYCS